MLLIDKKKSKFVKYIVSLILCVIFLMLAIMHYSELQYMRHIYPNFATNSDFKALADSLCALAKKDDIILMGYDQGVYDFYAKKYPCKVEKLTRSYDGRDITIDQVKKYQQKYNRIWGAFVNNYFRWGGGERVTWMDSNFIKFPFGATLHYWSRNEATNWHKPLIRQQNEIDLLKKVLDVAPYHYRCRNKLAKLQFNFKNYAEAITNYWFLIKQYPFEARNYSRLAFCYRNGFGVTKSLTNAKWLYKLAYWFFKLDPRIYENHQTAFCLLDLTELYFLMEKPEVMLKSIRQAQKEMKKYFSNNKIYLNKQLVRLELLRVKAFELLNDSENVIKSYNKAIELSQNKNQIERLLTNYKKNIEKHKLDNKYADLAKLPELRIPNNITSSTFSNSFPSIPIVNSVYPLKTLGIIKSNLQSNKNRRPVKIIVHGDSIAASPWPRHLINILKNKYPDVQFDIDNKAIGGFSTLQLEKLIFADAIAEYPDCIILHTAGNEKWSVDGFYRRYALILARIKRWCNADIVLLTPMPDSRRGGRNNDSKFYNAIVDLAKRFNCSLIDITIPFKNAPKPLAEYQVDNIHPNKTGNKFLAKTIVDSKIFDLSSVLHIPNYDKVIMPKLKGWWWKSNIGTVTSDSQSNFILQKSELICNSNTSNVNFETELSGTRLMMEIEIPSNCYAHFFLTIDGKNPENAPGMVRMVTTPKADPMNEFTGKHPFNNKPEKHKPLRLWPTSFTRNADWRMKFQSQNCFKIELKNLGDENIYLNDNNSMWQTNLSSQFIFAKDDVWWYHNLYFSNDIFYFSTKIRTDNAKILGPGRHKLNLASGLLDKKHSIKMFFKSKDNLKGFKIIKFQSQSTRANEIPQEFIDNKKNMEVINNVDIPLKKKKSILLIENSTNKTKVKLYDLKNTLIDKKSIKELPWLQTNVFGIYDDVYICTDKTNLCLRSWKQVYDFLLSDKIDLFTSIEKNMIELNAARSSSSIRAIPYYSNLFCKLQDVSLLDELLIKFEKDKIDNSFKKIKKIFQNNLNNKICHWIEQTTTQYLSNSKTTIKNCALVYWTKPANNNALKHKTTTTIYSINEKNPEVYVEVNNQFKSITFSIESTTFPSFGMTVLGDEKVLMKTPVLSYKNLPFKMSVPLENVSKTDLIITNYGISNIFKGSIDISQPYFVR